MKNRENGNRELFFFFYQNQNILRQTFDNVMLLTVHIPEI